jgi:hypothetical protein
LSSSLFGLVVSISCRLARVVPVNQCVDLVVIVHLNGIVMSSRIGMEAEAISRLTDGLQPPAIRAILVQCLIGELAPSAAVSRMLEVDSPSTVRAAIDDVTHRAATLSRAGDTMVRDRVDELTQIFVEKVSEVTDVGDVGKATGEKPEALVRRSLRPAQGDSAR